MVERKVAIVTDAASDVPPELVEKHQITILPVMINFEDKRYAIEGVEKGLPFEEFYTLIEKEVPTTAVAGPGHFVKTFEKAFEIADSVIGIFISNKMSAVYNVATSVAKQYFSDKDIHIYHDGVTSVGTAVIVLEVARLASEGKSREDIIKKVEEWIPKIQYAGIINTLDNLVKTGRLSKTKKFFADILKFKPIVSYLDAEVHVYGQIRADDELIKQQMKKFGILALNNMLEENKTIFVNHSRWPEAAQEIADNMKLHNPHNKEIIIQETGVLNSFFTGKKLLSLGYLGKFDPQWLLNTKVSL